MPAVATRREVLLKPQHGAQERFLSSPADIAIYGGARGGGKTWALLAEPLRHMGNPGFTAVMFRRTYPEIEQPGGMWPESLKVYPRLGAKPNTTKLSWRFPSGATVKFAHLQHETDLQRWLGSQAALIGFDQLETFTDNQFFSLLGSNRSTCGVRPYVRATANPEPNWLADFLAWWIDQETGLPIPERSGLVRWFVRRDNIIEWADSPDELTRRFPELPPKSVTFVPAKLEDNPALMDADPGYLANLMAQPHIQQQRWRFGNWKVSSAEGEWPADYFPTSMWFDEWPKDLVLRVLALDPSKGKDAKHGDYAAYVMLAADKAGTFWCDAVLERWPSPRLVDEGLQLVQSWQPAGFSIETNVFQELLKIEFLRRATELGMYALPIYGMNNSLNKTVRIRTLGPLLKQSKLRVKAGSRGAKLLVQQLRDFPNGEHDDGPDSLEMGVRLLTWLVTGRRNGPGAPTALAA
jgi:predicted phage terminase large subunit-like protein